MIWFTKTDAWLIDCQFAMRYDAHPLASGHHRMHRSRYRACRVSQLVSMIAGYSDQILRFSGGRIRFSDMQDSQIVREFRRKRRKKPDGISRSIARNISSINQRTRKRKRFADFLVDVLSVWWCEWIDPEYFEYIQQARRADKERHKISFDPPSQTTSCRNSKQQTRLSASHVCPSVLRSTSNVLCFSIVW